MRELPSAGTWLGGRSAQSRNNSGKLTSRRSQPLVGVGHVASAHFGWDGRTATLEAQAKNSIATGAMSMRETDTPVKVEVIEQRIRAVPEYVEMFNAALPGAPVTLDTIAQAIAAYERTMEPGSRRSTAGSKATRARFRMPAKRGFALFNTQGQLLRLSRRLALHRRKFHDIGTTKTDLGRGAEIKNDELMQYAFKTPTLRSVALRPPYMHDGSTATLHDVVRHYEKEAIDRPSRSPLFVPVELTEQERQRSRRLHADADRPPEGESAPALPGSPDDCADSRVAGMTGSPRAAGAGHGRAPRRSRRTAPDRSTGRALARRRSGSFSLSMRRPALAEREKDRLPD